MRLTVILILLTFFLNHTAYGQEQWSTTTVDAVTYESWLHQDWDELIRTGEAALKQGIDFYYLRYRLGIAWFKKKNYHRAIRHLQSAWQRNPNDPDLNEFLYYANLYSGREYEASYLETNFSFPLKSKLPSDSRRILKQTYVAYSNHAGATASDTDLLEPPVEVPGYQTISKGYHLLNAGIEHRAGSRFWLHHSYTHIRKNFYRYYHISGIEYLNPDENSYLNQYYLGTTALLRPGLDIRFGIHYIHLLRYESETVFDRAIPRQVSTAVTNQDMAGFVSLYKKFPFITTGFTSQVGNLNNATQLQQDMTITLYPLGNLNLYSTSTLSYQAEEMTDSQWRNEIILKQKMGFKIIGNNWVEGEAMLGNVQNFYANDAFYIFNDTDIIKSKYSARWHTMLAPQYHLLVDYVYMDKESQYIPLQTATSLPESITYNTHSITLTLLWKNL